MDGVLVVDKPAGLTSAKVVALVKKKTGARKVGHTGTLDPMATGVLPLCLGEATKIAGYLLADDKAYVGELELGVTTDTLDVEGEVTARDPGGAAAVDRVRLEAAIAAMVGPQAQVPPMYSAIRQGGVRLHELARAGKSVDRPPRPITVHSFELHSFAPPRARFAVHCSKGTYVRSLVRDLGEALGCGACLTVLQRTRSGAFTLQQAVCADDVGPHSPLVSPAEALGHLPAITVTPEQAARVADGQRFELTNVSETLVRLLSPAGGLLALARVDGGRVRYERVFRHAQLPKTT